MRARDQHRVLRRAAEGGAFPQEAWGLRWIEAYDLSPPDRYWRELPRTGQLVVAREALEAAEKILGERAKDRFAAFEIAYWTNRGRNWTGPFKKALTAYLEELP